MDSRPTSTPSKGRHARRRLATLGVLLSLAACGRDTPEVSVLGDVPQREPAPSTPTSLVSETPTTTATAVPEAAAAEKARKDAVPSPTVPATQPEARRSTTSTTVRARLVVEQVPEPEPAPPVENTVPRAVQPPVVPPGPMTLTSHGGPVRDHVSLVDNLRGRGLTVMPVSPISQPFLHGDGTILAVSGPGITATRLQSYQYETAEAAAADAATIGPDGSPRNVMVDWVSAPHLYLRDRVIVMYVGTDSAVTGLLTDLLGAQFAGR